MTNYVHSILSPSDTIHDLRNQLAVAKLAADSWKERADNLDAVNAEMLAALTALFENTDDTDDGDNLLLLLRHLGR